MAITVPQQIVDVSNGPDADNTIVTGAAGRWLVAIVNWSYLVSGKEPVINVSDASRNLWYLASTKTQQAYNTTFFTAQTLNTQIWICPAAQYDGWPYLYVNAAVQSFLSVDLGSATINLFEVAGMGNGFLTVDSCVTYSAYASGSIAMPVPAPPSAVNSLMVASAAVNVVYSSYSTTGTGWNQMNNNTMTTPDMGQCAAWREGTTASTVTFTLGAGTGDWAGVVATFRTTGVVPTGPPGQNPVWPITEAQIGYGYNLATPLAKVPWTDRSTFYWGLNTKRGIQYELGLAQAEASAINWRNNTGAFNPKPDIGSLTITATGTGSTTTFVTSAPQASVLSLSDVFRLVYSPLNTNTDFESGTTGWTGTGGTFTVIALGAGHVGQIVPTGAATVFVESTHIAVTAGQYYQISGLLQCAVARSCILRVNWYNSGGTLISSNDIVQPLAANTLGVYSGTFFAPTGAVTAGVAPTMTGTPAGSNILVMDNVVIKPQDETTVFGITKVSGGTVTFNRADGTAGGSVAVTRLGDTLTTYPIGMYTPYQVIAVWGGKRHYVNAGWAERWPQTWKNPAWGTTAMQGIGSLATMTAANPSCLSGEIMRRDPHSYWPLSDATGSTSASNVSGVGLAPLIVTAMKAGVGANVSADFGATTQGTDTDPSGLFSKPVSTTLIGDPGTCWALSGLTKTEADAEEGYALVANDSSFPTVTAGLTIWGMACLTSDDSNVVVNENSRPTWFTIRNTDPSAGVGQGAIIKVSVDITTLYPTVTRWDKSTHASTTTVCSGGSQFHTEWTAYALVFNQTTWKLYTGLGTLAGSGSCNLVSTFSGIDWCGEADQFFSGNVFSGLTAHATVFPRMLTLGEIQSLGIAAEFGYGADWENAKGRVQRKLDTANMKTSRVLDDTGNLQLSAEGSDASTVVDLCNQVGGYEDATVFEDASGGYQYRPPGRAVHQFPRAVLGQDEIAGELVYAGDQLESDFDPTYLYNGITVENTTFTRNGFTADTSTSIFGAIDDTSADKWRLRTYGRGTRISPNDSESIFNLVYWLLANYRDPKQRFQTIILDPSGTPDLWDFCLTVEVGDLITVARTPLNTDAITIDCVVLSIMHNSVPNSWTTALTVAPARLSGLVYGDDPKGIVGANYMTME